jgi:hypothetical protein
MRHPDFVAGRLSTAFVERVTVPREPSAATPRARAALAAAALHAERAAARRRPVTPPAGASPWAAAGRPGQRRFPR